MNYAHGWSLYCECEITVMFLYVFLWWSVKLINLSCSLTSIFFLSKQPRRTLTYQWDRKTSWKIIKAQLWFAYYSWNMIFIILISSLYLNYHFHQLNSRLPQRLVHYGKIVYTVMVINSTNINKKNNYLSSYLNSRNTKRQRHMTSKI